MQSVIDRILVSAAVVAVCAASIAARAHEPLNAPFERQVTEAPAEQDRPQVTFKAGVEAVTVSALVRDRRGRAVRNLTKADFEVIDSGFGRQILDVYTGDSPISLAVLLDISGSMAVGGNMDRAREAVAMATRSLRAGSDEAALLTFDSVLQEVVPFTTNLERVRQVSLEGTPWGKTSMFDAIAAASATVAERANRRRAMLVISDGVDTGSRMTAPEVSSIARSIDVPVYLLTVVHPLDHRRGGSTVVEADGRVAEIATLADLVHWTGGEMRIASTSTETGTAVRELFTELRHQYLISFEPGVRPGWHPLEIRTRNRDLIVHARSGYMVAPWRPGS